MYLESMVFLKFVLQFHKKHKNTAASSATDKLKASNFHASLLKIGTWEETYPDDGPGTLNIVLTRKPLFFRETNPQPRKHTLWQATQQPEIALATPYFESKRSVFDETNESIGYSLSNEGPTTIDLHVLLTPAIDRMKKSLTEKGRKIAMNALIKAGAIAAVLYEVSNTLTKAAGTQSQTDNDVKGTFEFYDFNILPLDQGGVHQAIMQLPEIKTQTCRQTLMYLLTLIFEWENMTDASHMKDQ
ncbi:hypothetical protein L2E82_22060 [Cichorium intybus]|uniref:Uncharacterized protein n=1 Tax=Cichorium intybus TaxID=13427 RepID=A0ACB9DXT4_CICIN|nr:hypothetical protein L2E82_22060 [Cichorium intybus]